MQKRKKIVTSVTIDPVDKKKADELHIKYSEAFDKGLKWMLSIKDKDNTKKRRLMEQENKVKKLKAQIKFNENLFMALTEIKTEYNEIRALKDMVSTDEYMDELIKLKAMRLEIPSKTLGNLFDNFLLGKKDEVKNFKRASINRIF